MVAVAHTDKVPEPRDRLAAHCIHKLGTAIIKERCKINHVLACMGYCLKTERESIDSVILSTHARNHVFIHMAIYHHHHDYGGLWISPDIAILPYIANRQSFFIFKILDTHNTVRARRGQVQ